MGIEIWNRAAAEAKTKMVEMEETKKQKNLGISQTPNKLQIKEVYYDIE